MPPATMLQYESPYPVYAIDWCRTPGSSHPHQRPGSSYRLALGSYTEDYRNRISIVALADDHVLIDDDTHLQPQQGQQSPNDFVPVAEAVHGYPVTKIAWEPSSAFSQPWKGGGGQGAPELITTTGDALKIWEFYMGTEADAKDSGGYVGRGQQGVSSRLTQKVTLSSSKNPNPTSAPLTSFSWNLISPSLIVTSSIDTTCTVWDISTSTAVTQLIAHDREVYDVSWVPGSTDSFVSVGADGSLRAFDLRSLEHSTILYETPAPKPVVANPNAPSPPSSARPPSAPLLRIAFDPLDANHLATFHTDSATVQILDMRSPGRPIAELKGHTGAVSAIGWGSQEGHMLATAADDSQVMVWDLSGGVLSPRTHTRGTGPASPRPDAQLPPRIVNDPFLAYTAPSEISNLTWSPPISNLGMGGNAGPSEWVAITAGRHVTALKV